MLTVIQNDPEVPLGSYAVWLRDRSVPFTICRAWEGEEIRLADGTAGVIVLGGAMGVHDTDKHPFLLPVKELIRSTVAAGIPFFGICLGGQLLADVLGAPVATRSPYGEKGTLSVSLTADGSRDPLFAGLPTEFVTFQWHQDSFAIPAGGVLLASSGACPNQAFRWGNTAYGVQFHPEVDLQIVETWSRWSEETPPFAHAILRTFERNLSAYADASERLLVNFLRMARLHP